MLSNEVPQNTAQIESYLNDLVQMRAARLASQLIRCEHNDDPREAPNPAHGVVIRRAQELRQYGPRPHVDPAVAAHNQAVCDLRKP